MPAQTCSIGELSREFDLTPRREGNRRIYSKRDPVRLKLILRGKRPGLSLAQVRARSAGTANS